MSDGSDALFPSWLEAPWQRLALARAQGRLPHALLISGPSGTGKRLLADRLVGLLLCERPDDEKGACGQCASCAWLRGGSHPDFSELAPEEAGKAIKIDQVRALGVELGMTSHTGRYKVALIAPAEAMNVNAANSLLKTLEEPTADTLLVLLSTAPGRLPATVRSRCQHLRIGLPARPAALEWLQRRGIEAQLAETSLGVAGGAPLTAVELADSDALALRDRRMTELAQILEGRRDPLQTAGEWLGQDEAQTLRWWQGWLLALVRWRQAGVVPNEPEISRMLRQIAETVDCRKVFDLSDRVAAAVNSLGSGLNRQLLLEDLLIEWARLAGKPGRRPAATGR